MRDLVKMGYEIQKKQKSDYERQKAFYEEFLQELAKEKSEDIAPHFTCVFDLVEHQYVVTLRLPISLDIFQSEGDENESTGEKKEQTAESTKDPKNIRTLTDDERMKCTVKWLNNLYTAYVNEKKLKHPCEECRLFEECGRNTPPQANFKVLEQFTSEGTVVSACIN